jgi:hypothetical protein
MTSSWTNKLILLALFAVLAGGLAAQEVETGDLGDGAAEAIALGKQLETAMRLLRAYQPDRVLQHLDTTRLPEPLKDMLRGWAWHQKGNYTKASDFFDGVEPDMLRGDTYLANRLSELKKTAKALQAFEVYETENFSIRYAQGYDRLMLQFLPEILERIYAGYGPMFDFEREEKIIVELMPDHELFSYASALTRQQIETTGTIALCVENRLVVLTPRRVLTGYYWPDVIAHEYIHYILTKQSADRAPLWLQEGVAKYFEARWESDDVDPLEPPLETALAQAIGDDSLLTVDQMMPSFAALPTAQLARQAYAQTTTMIDFLCAAHGEGIIHRVVTGLEVDGDLDRVLSEESDKDCDSFEASWREWLPNQGYRVDTEFTVAHWVDL